MKRKTSILKLATALLVSSTLFIACQKNDPANELPVSNTSTQLTKAANGSEVALVSPRMEVITPICASTYGGATYANNLLGVKIKIDDIGYQNYPPNLYYYKYEFRTALNNVLLYTATSNLQQDQFTWSGIQASTIYKVQFYAISKTDPNSITNGGYNTFTTLSGCITNPGN